MTLATVTGRESRRPCRSAVVSITVVPGDIRSASALSGSVVVAGLLMALQLPARPPAQSRPSASPPYRRRRDRCRRPGHVLRHVGRRVDRPGGRPRRRGAGVPKHADGAGPGVAPSWRVARRARRAGRPPSSPSASPVDAPAPPLLLCTSGTAAANLLPAVVEAGLSGIGVIVAHRRPAARAARRRRRPDDRPDRPLRLGRALVPRPRRARREPPAVRGAAAGRTGPGGDG